MEKFFEIIVNIITNVIVVLLVCAIFFMTYSYIVINFTNRDYVNYGGYTILEVASGSMSPAINQGALVVVRIDSDFKVNDIISYKSNKDIITHRVIDIDSHTGLITAKGDANNVPDLNVSPDSVIGRVVRTIPNAAIWRKVLMNPLVIIMLFVTLILFNFAFSYNRKKEEGEKKFLLPFKFKKITIRKREKKAFRD